MGRRRGKLSGVGPKDELSLGQRAAVGRMQAALFGAEPEVVSVGRYAILERVGAGAFGRVYAAYDPQLDRKVALKVLHRGAAEGGAERLVEEARAMAGVAHPNVAAVYEVGTWDSGEGEPVVYLAMEFVDGASLAGWEPKGAPRWSEALALVVEAGHGLAAAHRRGLVHRDFKPGNLLLGKDGRVRVVDFGLARERRDPETGGEPDDEARTTVAGTPAYMSPELREGKRADARSDQFAFCVTAWELLEGERPATEGEEPLATMPGWLRQALLVGLDPDPTRRHPDMDALLRRLERHRSRRARNALSFVGGASLVAAAAAVIVPGDETAPCGDPNQHWEGTWDPARADALRDALLSTNAAAAEGTWSRVSARLDEYRDEWNAQWTDACEATHVRHDQSEALLDLRVSCLRGHHRRTHALIELLVAEPGKAVLRGATAVAKLPRVAICGDVAALSAVVRPPEDPSTRKRVDELSERAEEIGARFDFGEVRAAAELVDALLPEAREVGYPTLTARLLTWRAQIADRLGEDDAMDAGLEAFDAALEAGDDRRAVGAAYALASQLAENDNAEAMRWLRHGRAIAARGSIGDDDELQGRAFITGARILGSEGHADEALARFEEGLAAFTRADPNHPERASILGNLGIMARRAGELERALELNERARTAAQSTVGEQHPVIGQLLTSRGMILAELGRTDDARAAFRSAIAGLSTSLGPDNPILVNPHVELADLELDASELATAAEHYREARRIRWQHHGKADARAAELTTTLDAIEAERAIRD